MHPVMMRVPGNIVAVSQDITVVSVLLAHRSQRYLSETFLGQKYSSASESGRPRFLRSTQGLRYLFRS